MQIYWYIELDDSVHGIMSKFEEVDSAIFSNREFMRSLWNDIYRKISEFIQKRFEEGKSTWKPLTPKYLKWKVGAVSNGVSVDVGQFGKRVCQLTAVGRLTDTMYSSATEKRFANIYETFDEVGLVKNGFFRYAISGSKLPYAVYFDDARPFFFLEQNEADAVLNLMGERFSSEIAKIW